MALTELIGFILRRDVYHCSREELYAMEHADVMADWHIYHVLKQKEKQLMDDEARKVKNKYNMGTTR